MPPQRLLLTNAARVFAETKGSTEPLDHRLERPRQIGDAGAQSTQKSARHPEASPGETQAHQHFRQQLRTVVVKVDAVAEYCEDAGLGSRRSEQRRQRAVDRRINIEQCTLEFARSLRIVPRVPGIDEMPELMAGAMAFRIGDAE
jgi:hypothetical protein